MTDDVLLYRRSLSLKSGAGQLLLWQAAGLEAAGASVRIGGARGRFRYWIGSGRFPRRMHARDVRRLAASGRTLVVDHELAVPESAVAYVHNLAGALAEHLAVPSETVLREAEFFSALSPGTAIVANSALVARDISRLHDIPPQRVAVQHPGLDSTRFGPDVRQRLRDRERARLACDPSTPLVGLVTSGYFAKRGLEVFLDAAERIRQIRPDARFLVVGSHRLPAAARAHPIFRSGHAVYRPKDASPARHYAPLDLMLYPAVYEEFGMVVAEAQAMGVPVVVSDRVGAAEVLPDCQPAPPAYSAEAFAARCLELLADTAFSAKLSAAGINAVRSLTAERYARSTAATILSQKRLVR